jgi:hypothetical protein
MKYEIFAIPEGARIKHLSITNAKGAPLRVRKCEAALNWRIVSLMCVLGKVQAT